MQGFELINAIKNDYLDVAKTIMQLDSCDINKQDQNGSTALTLACEKEYHDLVKILLNDKHCNANLMDKRGYTALLISIKKKNPNIFQYLMDSRKCNMNIPDIHGITPLMCGMIFLDLEQVQQIIKQGVDINAQDKLEGQTALMIAISQDKIDLVKLLLSTGKCNLNIQTLTKKGTAIMSAVHYGHVDIFKLLLHDSDLNIQDDIGNTVLLNAIFLRRKDFVKMLLIQVNVICNL